MNDWVTMQSVHSHRSEHGKIMRWFSDMVWQALDVEEQNEPE